MGRLTDDPKIEWTRSENSKKYATYTLAVNRRYKKQGQPRGGSGASSGYSSGAAQTDADFINCIAWGFNAEFAEKYMKRGVMFQVVGRLNISSWEDNGGKKHWKTVVIVDESYFTGDKGKGSSNEKQTGPVQDGFYPIDESVEDDDLPF